MFKQIDYTDLLGKEFEYGGRGPDKYDCYGLCMEIYKRLGKPLPEFHSESEPSLIHEIVMQGKKLFKEIPEPEPYCLAVFTLKPPYVSHIGVVLNPPYFIHILRKAKVCVERLDSYIWAKRVKGFYRWEG